MQRALLFAQLAVLSILASVHIAALFNDLYWIVPSLDLATHFLGGLWSALFFYWLGAMLRRVPGPVRVVALVLVLGVAWEVFELSFGISSATDYAIDTLTDLGMDVVGAIVAYAARFFFTHSRSRDV